MAGLQPATQLPRKTGGDLAVVAGFFGTASIAIPSVGRRALQGPTRPTFLPGDAIPLLTAVKAVQPGRGYDPA